MKKAIYEVKINDQDINSILDLSKKYKYIEDHSKYFFSFKKIKIKQNMSKSLLYLGIGIIMITIGGIGLPNIKPGFSIFICLFFILGGLLSSFISGKELLISLYRLKKLANLKKTTNSLQNISIYFYKNVMGKASNEIASHNRIIDVCEFFPVSVIEKYQKSGWIIFKGITETKKNDLNHPIKCNICQKLVNNSESYEFNDIPVSSDEPADLLYIKCEYCTNIFCYHCLCNKQLKEIIYLCPHCRKATNGWFGLDVRWESCRINNRAPDGKIKIKNIDFKQIPTNNSRIVNIEVYITLKQSNTLLFKNKAVKIDNKWFLITPEPGVYKGIN